MTKFFKQMVGMVLTTVLLFSFSQINAQTEGSGIIVRVTIGGIPTDYYPGNCGYGTANWGGSFTDALCGTPAWGHDITPDSLACDSIPVGQLTNKVALIRRGVCGFSVKALNAQKGGAVAVLIAQVQNNTTDDCFVQAMGATAPQAAQVTVPVLFICRNMANQIDAAIAAGQSVQVCFVKPDADITSYFFPPSHVQTPQSQIKTDTFGFGVNLTNTNAISDLTNVKVTAKVLKDDGTELYTTSLTIPTLTVGVTDSAFTVPGLYVPDLPIGTYSVTYSTTSDPIGGVTPVQDRVAGNFYVTDLLFANDNGATIGFRPSAAGDWAVGELYSIAPGTQEKYQCKTAEFAFATNATDYPLTSVTSTFYLFRVNDDVLADYSNFDNTQLFSASLEWKGLGTYTAPANITAYALQQVAIGDVNTNLPVDLDAGARYIMLSQYTSPTNLTFSAFNQNVDLPGVSTLIFQNTWFLGGFGAGTEGVVRMYLTLKSKTDEIALPENAMKVVPNPVVDQLNLAIQFDQPTNATITIADIDGRVISYENRQGLTNEMLHYPLSVASGTYLARIATEKGTLTKKFIVQK